MMISQYHLHTNYHSVKRKGAFAAATLPFLLWHVGELIKDEGRREEAVVVGVPVASCPLTLVFITLKVFPKRESQNSNNI